ncbi:hypothetical protein BS47DRAFT_1369589 [Hydnum rufescens UP504]|uniref:Uncharacterized protein n=1 Tax=Hydnum rufescens UP504 TaxID=1448309 RepID=A0A9P6DLM1_9AGAM|nr:hypothetical protein BS47DRAFT_1369589 [Hydnum rufescens UP504]
MPSTDHYEEDENQQLKVTHTAIYEFRKEVFDTVAPFKWYFEGHLAKGALNIETMDEFDMMAREVAERKANIIVEIKDVDLEVFRLPGTQLSLESESSGGKGYGTSSRAPHESDLSVLETMKAKFMMKLKDKWVCSIHSGRWCYRPPGTADCVNLTPTAFGMWSTALFEGIATINEPPKVDYFDPITHTLRPLCGTQSHTVSPMAPTAVDLPRPDQSVPQVYVTILYTLSNSVHSLHTHSLDPQKQSNQTPATPGSVAPVGEPHDVNQFIEWASSKNLPYNTEFGNAMHAAEVYPDATLSQLKDELLIRVLLLKEASTTQSATNTAARELANKIMGVGSSRSGNVPEWLIPPLPLLVSNGGCFGTGGRGIGWG